jgi:hypothetical protein
MNPGPNTAHEKEYNYDVVSYNCNGLGNRQKLKRIINKVGKVTGKDSYATRDTYHEGGTNILNIH